MTEPICDPWAWRAAMALMALGSTVSLAHADTLTTEGVQPWEVCAECHSMDGISRMARFPKLAGQRRDYIVKQVRDFRDGRRGNDGGQMVATASDVSDDDLAKAAEYFAGLPAPAPIDPPAGDTVEWQRGFALYQDGDAAANITSCRSCHDDREPNRPNGPFLKAQHAAYLAKQLRDWRSGARTNDESRTMPAIAAKLSEQDISALAAFLASQPRPPSSNSGSMQ
jgi:cytochrome c553